MFWSKKECQDCKFKNTLLPIISKRDPGAGDVGQEHSFWISTKDEKGNRFWFYSVKDKKWIRLVPDIQS